VPFADVAGQIIFNSNQGNDTLNVDFSKGSWAGHTVVFNGGSGTNTLNVTGGTFSKEQFDYTDAQDGDELLTDAAGTTTIDYTHLTPIDNYCAVADIVFNLPAGAQASLEDSGTATDGISQLRSLNNTFELTMFANPTNSLTINTAGNSLVQLARMDKGFNPYTESFSGLASDTFRFVDASAIPSANAYFYVRNYLLDLNGFSTTISGEFPSIVGAPISALVMVGGSVATGSGTLTLGGNVADLSNATLQGPATIAGNLSLGGATRTFDVQLGSLVNQNPNLPNVNPNDLVINATISDGAAPAGLVKNNTGALELTGNNTYTGPTTVNAGILYVDGSQTGSAITVNASATLGGIGTTGPIMVAGGRVNPGDPVATTGTLSGTSADFSNNGDLTMQVFGSTGSISNDRLNLSGALTLGGTSNLTLDLNGLTTSTGGPITVITDGSCLGTFANVTLINNPNNFRAVLTYAATAVLVTLVAASDHTADVSLDAASHRNLVLQDTTAVAGMSEKPIIQADTTNQQYVISDPNTIFSATVGNISADGHTVSVPFADVAGQIIFNSNQGNDTLNVDFSKGSWAGHTVVFNGGSGTNTLNVTGGTFSKEQFDYTNAHDGDELLTDTAGTTTIDYSHLTPIDNSDTAADVVFNLPAGAQARLEDNGIVADGISQLRSLNSTFELTIFANPTNSLTINTAGNSTVQLAPMDSGFTPVTESFQGQATDTFQLTDTNAVPNATTIILNTATLDLHGLSPTVAGLSGSGTVTSSVGGAETLTLNVPNGSSDTFSGVILDGSGTGSLIKSGAGTETLGGANTYVGTTNINGGTLTVTGTLNNLATAGAGLVSLNAAGVTLDGSGTLNGQVTVAASSFASPSQVQQLTITVPTGGTGITVAGAATFVEIGTTGGVTVNGGNATSTGVLVQGSALIENSTISNHHVDVNVNGGTAALQNTHMDTNFPSSDATLVTGLLVQGGGIVDAGQLASSATPLPGGPAGNVGYYGDITGLFSGTPLGSTAHSSGGNTFNGYTLDTSATATLNPGPAFPQAIRDENTGTAPFGPLANGVEQSFNYGSAGPQLDRMDVTAQGNTWNGNAGLPLSQIEQLIFHDNDDPNVGFVSFGNSTAPAPVVVGKVNYLASVNPSLTDLQSGRGILLAGTNLANGQNSVIRYIQVTYSSYVFLDPNLQSATDNFGVNLIEINGPNYQVNTNPANGRLIQAAVLSSMYNRTNGNDTVIYRFTGPGTEYGSLEDGNYQLQFNESAIQGGGPSGPALAPAGDPFAVQAAQFHRYFGDANGDRAVDNTELVAFQAAYRSRLGMSSYRSYFDFNSDGLVDATDYSQFQRRLNSQLNADGTVSVVGFAQPNTVFVDDSWAGTANDTEPATDPTVGGVLVFGVNAFADIQSGINAVTAGGTVVVYGGTYATPTTLNINQALTAIEVSVNPDIPAEATVNINEAVTLTDSATFLELGVGNGAAPANLTFGGTVDSGATAQNLTVTSVAGNSLTFNGALGSSSALNVLTINDPGPAKITGSLAGAAQLVKDQAGTLALTSPGSPFTGTISINGSTLDLQGSLTGAGGIITLASGSTLTSTTKTGQIDNRTVVVPAGSSSVVISGLAQLSAAGGTAVEVDGSATLTGDTLSNSTNGVQVTGAASLTGDTFKNNQTAVRVNNGGQLLLGAGDVVQAGLPGQVGLLVSGPAAQLPNLTLNNTAFTGFAGAAGAFYIELTNGALQGPQFLDATHATFEGTAGAALTATALQNTENQIHDYRVDNLVGLVLLQKGVIVGGQNLLIVGTDNADFINVNATSPANVSVSMTNRSRGGLNVSQGRVIVFTLGGNDFVNITGSVPVEVHCGAGADTVLGGSGQDVLLGGPGNDFLVGRGMVDVLVGGGGHDILLGLSGSDLLIAGTLNTGSLNPGVTPNYNTYAFLDQVRTEWLNGHHSTGPLLQALVVNGVSHVDTAANQSIIIHSGGPSAFLYNRKGKYPDRIAGLTGLDADLGS
jgi:autotransporter-associated beta strand protein